MPRALRITLIIFGAILCIEGVLDMVLPVQRAAGMALGQCASQAQLAVAILGATWIAAGAWTIAAARDPLRHLDWVRFALTLAVMLILALSGAVLRGNVAFRAVAIDIGVNALFVALLLAFYPRQSRA